MKKTILIDLRWIKSKTFDGIARESFEVTKRLVLDKNNNFLLLYFNDDIKNWLDNLLTINTLPNVKWHKISFNIASLKDIMFLPFVIKKLKIDIYYTFNFITSFFHFRSYNTIITVNDLIPFLFKKSFLKRNIKWFFFTIFPFSTKYIFLKSHLIISISNSTKNDLIRLFKVEEEKIKVMYLGFTTKNINNIKPAFELPKKYLLYVGRKDFYKNLDRLIKAYSDLDENFKRDYSLIIAGKSSKSDIDLKKMIPKNEKIHLINDLHDNELAYLYKNASCFIYPSLYEGFGLPILEAMSYKIPIVTSNVSSMPEVANNAAIFVDPLNLEDMKIKIQNLLNDDTLKEKIIENGKIQLKKFSWDKTANEILKLF